ncbi:MAG: NYN domain-containing protein [Gemmatimonadota bacterium]|nr:NYN domain-containing protein [Gemmatimonadota bacterium]
MSVETAALLIDFDNVTMGIRSNLGQELRNLLDSDVIRGKVAVQRAYADWRRYPQYIVPLSEASIDLIFAPAYGSSKKNATDIRLAIDACELVFTRPEIGTFILLSGDSDFSSLVLKLKEYGKYVIGVGLQESASDILVQNCDEYYSYNQVSGLVSAGEVASETHDPWVLVSKAVRKMTDRGDVMRSDRLKQVMLEIDSNFDEKDAGFSKFNKFLAEATHRNLIRMRKGQNGQYEVSAGPESLDGAPQKPAEAPAGTRSSTGGGRSRRGGRGRSRGRSGRSSESRSSGKGGSEGRGGRSEASEAAPEGSATPDSLQRAYEALASVVDELDDGEGVRDSMAKRKLIARDSGFDEGRLGFPKFSLFLKQAHEDGAVVLTQRDDRNYYLSPAKPSAGGTRGRGRDRAESRSDGPGGSGDGSPTAKETGSSGKPAKRGLLGRLLGKKAEEPKKDEKPVARPSSGDAPAATADRSSREPAGRSGAAESTKKPERDEGAEGSDLSRKTEARASDRNRGGGGRPQSGRGSGRSRGRGGRSGGRTDTESRQTQTKAPESRERDRDGVRRDEVRDRRGESKKDAGDGRTAAAAATGADEPRTDQGGSGQDTGGAPVEDAPAPRRTLRHRRGSRGRPSAKPSGTSASPKIGPVSRGDDDTAKEDSSSGSNRSSDDRSTGAARAGVGARTGSRGGSSGGSTAGRGSSAGDTATADRGDDAGGVSHEAGPAAEAVEHMVRNYAGVGKRTAEVLVDRFGGKVFEVIDAEPERLTEVLSEGRAKAVVAAREQERAG